MTPAHIATTAFFILVIIVSVAAIVRSFREEWTRVRMTFGAPPVSILPHRVETTHRPVADIPLISGGALEAR